MLHVQQWATEPAAAWQLIGKRVIYWVNVTASPEAGRLLCKAHGRGNAARWWSYLKPYIFHCWVIAALPCCVQGRRGGEGTKGHSK